MQYVIILLQFVIERKGFFRLGISNLPSQAEPYATAIADRRAGVCAGMKALLLILLGGGAYAQLPDVHDIMRRVAFNQAKTVDAREQFLYHQRQNARLRQTNGKLMREEFREYDVAPTLRGINRTLIGLQGRYWKNGDYVVYDERQRDSDGIDAALVEAFVEEFHDERKSRDGIDNDLFPLTYHQQLKYEFRLTGREMNRGRSVYRVAFIPKDRYDWKGEALIDAEESQPVFVTTKMAHGVPLPVKALLGTDVKGLGFSVSYQKFADGVWFPVSYGGEFELHILFVYKRSISIALTNTDFRRVDVSSQVSYSAETQ